MQQKEDIIHKQQQQHHQQQYKDTPTPCIKTTSNHQQQQTTTTNLVHKQRWVLLSGLRYLRHFLISLWFFAVPMDSSTKMVDLCTPYLFFMNTLNFSDALHFSFCKAALMFITLILLKGDLLPKANVSTTLAPKHHFIITNSTL